MWVLRISLPRETPSNLGEGALSTWSYIGPKLPMSVRQVNCWRHNWQIFFCLKSKWFTGIRVSAGLSHGHCTVWYSDDIVCLQFDARGIDYMLKTIISFGRYIHITFIICRTYGWTFRTIPSSTFFCFIETSPQSSTDSFVSYKLISDIPFCLWALQFND